MMERAMGGEQGMIWKELGDVVLSWSVEDILNEKLFADKVEHIPRTFQSVKGYLESYIPSLLEETRAELASCLGAISNAPCSKIHFIEKAEQGSELLYYVDVDHSINESCDTTEDYKARNGDFYILSSLKPEKADDLFIYGETFCMVVVTEVVMDDAFQRRFKVKASKNIDRENELTNYQNAICLTNIIRNTRIWRAVHLNSEMNNNFNVIEAILHPTCMGDSACSSCSSWDRGYLFAKHSDEIVYFDLNQSQMQSLKSVLSAISCPHQNSVRLIWGPPGTGKTKLICAILLALLHMKCRILTCAPKNIAVVGVCSHLIWLVKNLQDSNNLIDSPFLLGDIILFDCKNQMKIYGELQVVFLEYREEQLEDCLSPTSGWKHRITAMISFFENWVSQYELYIENRSDEDEDITFLKFFRKQFNAVASPLEKCLKNLCIHLSRRILSKMATKNILDILNLLGTFRTLIFKDDACDDGMQETFLHEKKEAERSLVQNDFVTYKLGLSTTNQLKEIKGDCLNLLKVLNSTLQLPYAVHRNCLKKLCLSTASIIFCTASSSSLLHDIEVGHLDVLIVDEAAGLKECETATALRLNGIKHAILVGDEFQLQSTVKSQVCKAAGFGLSLFERLVCLGHPKDLLNFQYRMHPSISFFPNIKFYGNQILDGPNVKDSNYGKHCSDLLFGPYAFVNITDGREEFDDNGDSHKNMVEVAILLHLIRSIFKSWEGNEGKVSIGVISWHSSQVKSIQDKLGSAYHINKGFDVKVNSVDAFQGEEYDIIILSTVRCNRQGSIGFLGDIQRINVALTRARHCLWILGNAATLLCSGTIWMDILHDAKVRQCFFNANDKKGLAQLILRVKHELDQLDDFFSPDSILNTAMWKVLFSADFRKSLESLKSLQTKREVIQMLLRLANGWRSKRNNAALSDSFQLAKIYKIRERYLVWTIDIVKDERYIQVIKVWDILPMSQLTSFTKRLDNIFEMYTDSYVGHCKTNYIEGNIEVPVSWSAGHDILRYKKYGKLEMREDANFGEIDDDVLENSKVRESLLLMKFHALTSGIANHLLTSNDGTELSIPFELTDEEKQVVRFQRSSFILGRSGTGKTTILTTKLAQKEQQHCLAYNGVSLSQDDLSKSTFKIASSSEKNVELKKRNILRQVFITVSPKLCMAIKDHISRLTSYARTGYLFGPPSAVEMHDTSDHLADFKDIPDTLHDLPNKHYPLVITYGKFLMMLDGTMRSSFFEKFYSERDFSSKSLALQMLIQNKEVNYEKFVGSYWPHFNRQMTKKLDASAVYTEIISHIKGGLEVGSSINGKLGRNDYIMLAEKRVSPFCREIREIIYDIFLDYEKRKCINGEFDISDFVIDLHQMLRCNVYLGDKFDFVYVDEVQDLTMSQISLLKYVCPNYEEGFNFAGDTAQTIARGVDFRFEDIRCIFYKEFLSELRIEAPEIKKEKERMADNFQLNQNFRTHSGVLNLARSIMDLLYNFFPLNIDKIVPEISLIYGESPVLLEDNNNENAIITIFGSTAGSCGYVNEFGAEQVILVRDECVKKQIVNLVGNKALVLTIIECKGLEFQDVLLYNFFGGSPLKNKWRVIYEYMEKYGVGDQSSAKSCPSFNHGRYNLLCSELKQLYVAVTRTRQRLWVCENSNDYCKPIFDYWKSLCLIQVRHLDSSLAQAMKVVSTSDDWRLRGIKLFNEENFEMATMCFERAGDKYRERWARAAGLVCTADRAISSNPGMAEAVLKKAADIYETIGKSESAATCYIKYKDFNTAGRLYLEKCDSSKLEVAGDCFAMAENWSLAADVYAKAKCSSKCLSMCSRGELFDAGLQFMKQWKEDSPSSKHEQHQDEVEISFLESCVRHYVRLQDIKCLVEMAKVFKSMDLIRKFLKSKNLLDELLELEIIMENYLEAANIAHFKANILLEAEMLQKATLFEKSASLIIFYILVNSLWSTGSKGWPLKGFAQKEELLNKAKRIAKQVSDSFYDRVSFEADIISDGSKDLFNLSQLLIEARKYESIKLEIFTLRKIVDVHLQLENSKYIWEPGLVSNVEKHANQIMSLNICSVESLLHIWELWKEKILNVISHLRLSMRPSGNDFELFEQFCFEYLGVINGFDQGSLILLNPQAAWVNICRTPQKDGNPSRMDNKQFKASAQHYWRMELISVGVAILEKLESLLIFSNYCAEICSTSAVSEDVETCNYFERKVLFPFSKGRLILSIHGVVNFLRQWDIISLGNTQKIERIFTLACEYFFSTMFPARWKEGSSLSMLTFHESMNVKEIIEESIDKNLCPVEGKLTYGQVGRVVMLLFLSGGANDKLFDKTMLRFCMMPPWNGLIGLLRKFLNCSSQRISLIMKLKEALEDAFSSDWRGKFDYISPHCFMYLVDCLLFCASSCLGSGCSFFSTKSTVFEMVRCHGLKGYMDTSLAGLFDIQSNVSVHDCLNFLIEIIKKLLRNKKQLMEWVLQSSMHQFDYGHLIVKMVITLCLAHLNTGRRTNYLKKFLLHNNIIQDLHMGFRDAMAGYTIDWQNLSDFSNALMMNQDSLVIVVSGDNTFDFSNLNAIVLNSADLRCPEDTITKLFQKKLRTKWHIQSEQVHTGNNSREDDTKCNIEKLDSGRSIQIILPEQNQHLDLGMRNENIHQDLYLQKCIDLNTKLRRCDEVKMEEIIHCLSALTAWFSKDVQERNGAPDILLEVRKMLMEIKFHSSLIDGGIEPPCMMVKELEARCPGWKWNLISFIDSLVEKIHISSERTSMVVENIHDKEAEGASVSPCGQNKNNGNEKKPAEGASVSPCGQNINKGNRKKSKQKNSRNGKGKWKKK